MCASAFLLDQLKDPHRATLYLLYTSLCTGELNAIRKHKCFLCSPFYGRACRWAMLGELKPKGPKGLALGRLPGNLPVVYLATQNGNLGYGKRRCGFHTKHRSTKSTMLGKSKSEGRPRLGAGRTSMTLRASQACPINSNVLCTLNHLC